jgi:hypothetical protein
LNPRTLKIEAEGEYGKIKPKIRLCGKWLEQAGFKPGSLVNVKCIAEGVMELRCENPTSLAFNEASKPIE